MGRKNLSLIALIIITLILVSYLILETLNQPYIGITVDKTADKRWKVTDIDQIGWANLHGIKIGDIVLSVNRRDPGDWVTVKNYNVIEQANKLEISSNGRIKLYEVSKDLIPELMLYHTVIPVVVFTILFMLCGLIYIRRKDDTSSIYLILFFLVVGFSYISAGGSARTDTMSVLINRVAFISIPALFLRFLNTYFDRFKIKVINDKLLICLYIVDALALAAYLVFMILGTPLFTTRNLFLVIFSIGVLLCISAIFCTYVCYKSQEHKPVLKIMILTLIMAFSPFVFLVALPSALIGIKLMSGAAAAAFLVFIPIAFIYLIMAKRLFDIDFVISRIRYYLILALFPTTIIILYFNLINQGLLTNIQLIKASVVVYLGIAVFLYLKDKIDLDLHFNLSKQNFWGGLDRFSNDIAKVMTVSDLDDRLISEITEVLAVKQVCLLEQNLSDFSIRIKKGNPAFDNNAINCLSNDRAVSVGEILDRFNGLIVGVGEGKNKINFLWIGEKVNNTRFNRDEKTYLQSVARYVNLVYENLRLIEGLAEELEGAVNKQNTAPAWILRLIFNLSEKERRWLASDLHDSALQEQLVLYRKLDAVLAEDKVAEIHDELSEVKEGLLDVIHQIRETCNELRPPFLIEKGIVEVLESLFAHAQLRSDYVINFDASKYNAELNDEQVLTFYRIVQELLTNAGRHSKASQIDITLASKNDTIIFEYRDNGVGVNLDGIHPSFKHMGLSGIKERVYSLEGETYFYSRPGGGFMVCIEMPTLSVNGLKNVL